VRAPTALRVAQALLLLLLLGLLPQAGAATREFYFARLGSERGLVQGSVSAMTQDRQGFVWVGTQGGLHRYDGERYRLFRHDPADPTSLPDSFVTALAPDVDGHSLWIGTYSQYVARLDLRSGRIHRYAQAVPDRRDDRQVLTVLAEREAVWIGTVAGLDRLDPRTGERLRVLAVPGGPRTERRTHDLLRDRDGRLWYACDAGLYVLDGASEWRRISTVPAHALHQGRDGRVLVGSADGLATWSSSGLTPIWPRAGTVETARSVRSIAQDPAGRIWIAVSTAGLRRIDPRGDVVALRQDARLPGALPEDSVNALLVDASGMLWAGGQYRGPSVADPSGSAFALVINSAHQPDVHPAANESIRAVHGTPGVLWIGTDAHRFLRYDLRLRRIEDITARMPAPSGRVVGFAAAGGSGLWLATETGLLRLDTNTLAMQRIDLGIHSTTVLRAIARDADGGLWLGTSGSGALFHDPSTGRTRQFPAGIASGALAHPNVHAALVDRRGRVWLGTGDGLDLLDPRSGRVMHFRQSTDRRGTLVGNVVRALLEDSAGRIWVGTHAGLNRAVEAASGISFEQPLVNALPAQRGLSAFSLQEAPAGHVWAGTDAGIVQFHPASGEARLFALGDGLQDLEFNGGASARLPDGRLAFGGVRGINIVDTARVGDERYAAPLRLLSARSDGRALDDAPWQPASIDIPPGADLLRVRIGALDFAPAATPRYRYRLEGFDKAWVDNGTSRDITYTQLPPGRYTFRAQATDRGGRWAESSELRMPVNVATPIWRQPIVLLLAGLVVLAPVGAAVWQWRERLRRERGYLGRLREREERLKLALWASGEQFWDYDLHGGVLHRVQSRDADGHGRGIASMSVSEHDHQIHPEDLPRVQQQLRRHLSGELPTFESQHRIATEGGDGWTWVRARGRVVERDDAGRALRIAGTARDITATRRAERDRRVASEVLRSMAEAVCVFDDDFNFISVNPAFTRMTGYVETEVIGQSTGLIDSRQHDEAVYRHMREELRRDGRWSGELWQRRKDGSEFLCWLQASVVLDTAGQRGHWVAVLSDITDQKRAEQELRYLANYDTLTGLPNRALLSERLSRAVARSRRHESRLAVLFLDLDRFKDINDSLGHAAGDAILRATAARLQHAVGGHHTVARLGGDEFTVMLEHVDGIEEAEDVARQLLAAFEQPLDAGDLRDIVISPSIGIALFPDHAETPSDLLKHADTAMYKAKSVGRRTYMRYAGTMEADVRRRASLSAALRKVIDRDELRLVYQPRLDVGSGRLVGVEALLRWKSDEFGHVSPAQFIPLAEESGLILEIGEWALRRACMQLQAWRADGLDAAMSVNVSALQLRRGDLSRVIEATLHETGLPAHCLEIELTESIVMAEETWPALHAIRELGVRMAIDDFGTGYSSLAYLKRLPINTLKIDREFIGDLTRDPDDEAITSAVIAMGHSLGLHVVAEGVETLEQLAFLRRYGCDEIQGYWLARPLEADDCFAFLRDWRPATAFGATSDGPAVAP
jgi:diguanylate cyclase (GGDEF)-like protein/PAS domain S-box-containing protein